MFSRVRPILAVVVLLAAMLGFATPVSAAPAPKVDVCHVDGQGNFDLINVSENAYQAHVDHGDASPGDPVPGMANMVFDGDCQPVQACITTEQELRDAALNSGDYCITGTIFLSGDQVLVGTTLSLTSADTGNASISGSGLSRVFEVVGGDLTLTNITVTGGLNLNGSGGGISVSSNGFVTLNGTSTIRGNRATIFGGGIAIFDGLVTLNDTSTITGNVSDFLLGGGVAILGAGAFLTLNDGSSVSGNVGGDCFGAGC